MAKRDYLYRDTGYTKDGTVKIRTSYKIKRFLKGLFTSILFIALVGIGVWALLSVIKPKAYNTANNLPVQYTKDLGKIGPDSIILVRDNRSKNTFGKEYVVESHIEKLPGSYVKDEQGGMIQLGQDQYLLTFEGAVGIVNKKDIIGVKK